MAGFANLKHFVGKRDSEEDKITLRSRIGLLVATFSSLISLFFAIHLN